MSRRFTILARKFDPFEKAARTFWDQFAAARGLDLELDLVPLDLPELHAAILTKRFDVAHVNTDWLAECWASGCLEDSLGQDPRRPARGLPGRLARVPPRPADLPRRPRWHPLPRRSRVPHLQEGPLRIRARARDVSSALRHGADAAADLGGVRPHRRLLRPSRRGPARHALRPVSRRAQQRVRFRPAGHEPRRQPRAGGPGRPRFTGGTRSPSRTTAASSTARSSTHRAGSSNRSAPAGPSPVARSP